MSEIIFNANLALKHLRFRVLVNQPAQDVSLQARMKSSVPDVHDLDSEVGKERYKAQNLDAMFADPDTLSRTHSQTR